MPMVLGQPLCIMFYPTVPPLLSFLPQKHGFSLLLVFPLTGSSSICMALLWSPPTMAPWVSLLWSLLPFLTLSTNSLLQTSIPFH
ncbi:hypothetical protein BDF14DRAFT_1859783 [Spinellus fusiger]|nr:hypothetical protein BDF14DRAFT_1859783 [Spinellus fusiger]